MKVLSLDLDYITGPYHKFINKIIYSKYNDRPNKYWEDIDLNFGDSYKDFRINFDNLNFFFEVFNKSFLCSKKVVFSYYHDCILHYLNDSDSIDIVNIDMHHDLYYQEGQVYSVESLNTCDECNWVLYLDQNKKLKNYIWIRDADSFLPKNDFFSRNNSFYYKFTVKEEYNISSYLFDLVFVCLSPQYIIPAHWHYFELLKNTYKNISGKEPIINNTRFDVEFDITKNNSGLIL